MNRQVLKLAVPSILANVTIPLVGMVDTAIVGHLADASIIGGIAIGTMLFDLLYWNFAFLRVGTSGLTAQAFGAGERHHCARLLTQSLAVAFVAALFIYAVQWAFVWAVLQCVPCSAEAAEFARRYFFVRVWAAPCTLALMALKGWFIGMQDTVSPMITDIVVNVVNMVASYLLAVKTPMGAIGVAYGTVIAQVSGLIVALTILLLRYRKTFHGLLPKEILGTWQDLKHMMHLNGNLFIRSLCFMIIYVGFTALSARYGDEALAVGSILMKLFMLFSYFADGFAYAGEALTGRYIGEGDRQSVKQVVWELIAWSTGIGLLFTLIYGVWGQQCIWLMTDQEDILQASLPFLGWLTAMPLLSTFAFMWDGIFVGATDGRSIRNVMIWASAAFVLAYVATEDMWGVQALYVAYFAHLVARVVYLSIKWRKTYDRAFAKPEMESHQE